MLFYFSTSRTCPPLLATVDQSDRFSKHYQEVISTPPLFPSVYMKHKKTKSAYIAYDICTAQRFWTVSSRPMTWKISSALFCNNRPSISSGPSVSKQDPFQSCESISKALRSREWWHFSRLEHVALEDAENERKDATWEAISAFAATKELSIRINKNNKRNLI